MVVAEVFEEWAARFASPPEEVVSLVEVKPRQDRQERPSTGPESAASVRGGQGNRMRFGLPG